MKYKTNSSKLIGGFFELEIPSTIGKNSILDLWNVKEDNAYTFQNARSALHYLLGILKSKRLFVPAYICREIANLECANTNIIFYSLNSNLSPNVEFLDANLKSNDIVLGIDYFGREPDLQFRNYVANRKDIIWIEDRAHALSPATHPWGDWILYSPRKLLGVPDGGILVKKNGVIEPPMYESLHSFDFIKPALARFEDQKQQYNEQWYQLYLKCEHSMKITTKKMSHFSFSILDKLDPFPIIKKRQDNYKILHSAFKDIALLSDEPNTFAPFGFPVRIENCNTIWPKLCKQGIFAARHWLNLPSDPFHFVDEHKLSENSMTLPCDHRYDSKDMDHIINTLIPILK